MYDLCIFAGTTEGRKIVEFLADTGLSVYACVATEYGDALLPHTDHVTMSARRLSRDDMEALFSRERFRMVVDATHPYATEATRNIADACAASGTEYLRLNREAQTDVEGAVYVGSVGEAADYLKGTSGNVLIVTGSKELSPYTAVDNYRERLYVRVLPTASSVSACERCGIAASHIIAMQGPFSKELNRALIRMADAKFLVTKDSGSSGGFFEKIEAAREEGAVSVIIGRPPQRDGQTYDEAVRTLCRRFNLAVRPQVSVVGIGMGNPALLTAEAERALRAADCVIGAERAVEAAAGNKARFISMDNAKILAYIRAHPEHRRIAVVMSGDTGFYSGAKKLLPLLRDYAPRVCPGISSLQYLCAKLGTSWDDACVLSLHGRNSPAVPFVAEHKKVFALLGGSDAVNRVCAELCDAGFADAVVSAGERLSYGDEKITTGTAEELKDIRFDPLSAVLIRNKSARPGKRACCLPDDAFIRSADGAVVPMTKSEVRAISVAKLMLDGSSVVYDIGAGTGSVSVEMAGICTRGRVYAVECKKDAAELIRRNKKKFGLHNLSVVEGAAPGACGPLPPPTHAFIGGTSGNMRQIMEMLAQKNPQVRIVANLITLESIADMTRCLEELGWHDAEIVQVTVARSKKLGSHHLMSGQNPIMIVTCQKTADGKERVKQ